MRSRVVWSLRWLAAEPDAALGALRFSDGSAGLPADEIARTLEDDWIVVDANKLFDTETRRRLAELDELFGSISGGDSEQHWTYEAVRSDPTWQLARAKARDLLELLGASRDDENLFGHV